MVGTALWRLCPPYDSTARFVRREPVNPDEQNSQVTATFVINHFSTVLQR